MTAQTAPTTPALLPEQAPAARLQLEELWRQQVASIVTLSRDALPSGDADGCRANELLVASRLLAAGWQQLAETEAALARLKEGTYGACEHCAMAINAERLEILPAARYCVACQAKHSPRP